MAEGRAQQVQQGPNLVLLICPPEAIVIFAQLRSDVEKMGQHVGSAGP